LVLFPVTVLIMATALACGPLLGFAYSLTGCLLSATLTYGLGYFFGHDIIRSLPGARLGRLSQRLAQHGFVAILLVRIVPVAPFTVVNMVAGAAHIRLRNFILGTCVGMLPGLLVMTVFGGQLEDFIRQPNGGGVFTLIGLLALLGLLTLWVRRRFVHTDALQAPEIAADE
jgi:phospholipase D1/2